MDTSIFRYVLEVEKYRNITQAAKRLFISQPALTKQLNKLEKELAFRLLTARTAQSALHHRAKFFSILLGAMCSSKAR